MLASLIVSKYGVFSDSYYPAFRLNTERYRVCLLIQSEYGKIRTRKNSVLGHFSRSGCVCCYLFFALNNFIILLNFIQFILIQFIIKQNSNKVIEVNVCLVWQLSIHFWLLGRWWTYVVYKMYVGGWEDLFKKFFDKWENNNTSFQLLDAYAPWNKGCRIGINFCKQKQNYL